MEKSVMHRLIMSVAVVSLGFVAMAAPAQAGLGEAGELEHARANARAGGPLNDRDRELLDRWGCLSGMKSAYCNRDVRRSNYKPERRRQ